MSAPDTQLSEAVAGLRKAITPARGEDAYNATVSRAMLRTVLEELERRDEFIDGLMGQLKEANGRYASAWALVQRFDAEAAALRSVPRFTQEDVEFLESLAWGRDGIFAFRLRDLASRISQHLEGQKDG